MDHHDEIKIPHWTPKWTLQPVASPSPRMSRKKEKSANPTPASPKKSNREGSSLVSRPSRSVSPRKTKPSISESSLQQQQQELGKKSAVGRVDGKQERPKRSASHSSTLANRQQQTSTNKQNK